ncbi:hypothetical protein ACIQT3_12155 [Enterobacter sichuanensis]|uniref:hypothetical protein n=1 Tax=Enterobacter sichuanensis TaxID=2071710 RepID=UPI00383AE834
MKRLDILQIIFMASLLASVAFCYFLFMEKNDGEIFNEDHFNSHRHDFLYGIDYCRIRANTAQIEGWSTIKSGQKNTETNIYIEKSRGLFKKLQKITVVRPDVSKKLKAYGFYDRSGFLASTRDSSLGNSIIIEINDNNNGEKYAKKIKCR